jgi:hypothetical protein
MVLFLFVIMLLGEKTTDTTGTRRLPFSIVRGAFGCGGSGGERRIDLAQPAEGQPRCPRMSTHRQSYAMDVYSGQTHRAESAFSDASDFVSLAPGDHTVTFNPTGLQSAIQTAALTLKPGQTMDVVAYGTNPQPTVALLEDNLNALQDRRKGRVTIFNAYSETPAVNLVDMGHNLRLDAENAQYPDDRVILSDLAQGASATIERPEGTSALAFVTPEKVSVIRLREFEVKPNTSQLVVLTGERAFDGTLRPVALPLVSDAAASFGGPQAVGQLLFTRYLLPVELVAILLLVSMIGAVVLAHREDLVSKRRLQVRRKVSRPLTRVIAAQTGVDMEASGAADEQPKLTGD